MTMTIRFVVLRDLRIGPSHWRRARRMDCNRRIRVLRCSRKTSIARLSASTFVRWQVGVRNVSHAKGWRCRSSCTPLAA